MDAVIREHIKTHLPTYVRKYGLWFAISACAAFVAKGGKFNFDYLSGLVGLIIGMTLFVAIVAAIALYIGGWMKVRGVAVPPWLTKERGN